MKDTTKYYKLRIFPARVGITFDFKMFEEIFKKYCPDEEPLDKRFAGYTIDFLKNDRLYILVYLNIKYSNKFELDIDSLSHETVHAVKKAFKWIDEDDPGEEIEAYLTGYINQIFVKELIDKKYKINLKKK